MGGIDPEKLYRATFKSKSTTLYVNLIVFFSLHFLPSVHNLDVKMPNFTFYEGRKQTMTFFFPFLNFNKFIHLTK